MFLLNCAICGKIKSTFIKNKEVSNDQLKTNKIINRFLLKGQNLFMLELQLKQPKFTCSACGRFTKHSERVPKFRGTGNLKYLYRNE